MPAVDVVVVSYNSRDHLRGCVQPLSGHGETQVIVVDNGSGDGSLETVADLDVTTVALGHNRGFAHGCNVGAAQGSAPFVLLLNPDARLDRDSLERLVRTMDESPRVGAVAPKIIEANGTPDWSQRRFPRVRSTFAQALFLHRLFPLATWTDELVRDPACYERRASPEWVSGACLLVRRSALERLQGLDEGFFLYCEDMDLCRRLRDAGWEILYEPGAECRHIGGASAPRAELLPVLAASRVRYARLHQPVVLAALERVGVVLGGVTHAAVTRRGRHTRRGHLRAVARALGFRRTHGSGVVTPAPTGREVDEDPSPPGQTQTISASWPRRARMPPTSSR